MIRSTSPCNTNLHTDLTCFTFLTHYTFFTCHTENLDTFPPGFLSKNFCFVFFGRKLSNTKQCQLFDIQTFLHFNLFLNTIDKHLITVQISSSTVHLTHKCTLHAVLITFFTLFDSPFPVGSKSWRRMPVTWSPPWDLSSNWERQVIVFADDCMSAFYVPCYCHAFTFWWIKRRWCRLLWSVTVSNSIIPRVIE